MKNKIFLKNICFILLVVSCQLINFVCAQDLSVEKTELYGCSQSVLNTECTYLEKAIENNIMPHDEIEDEIPQDIISITIEQSVSTAQNALYVCLLPFSIITAPFVLFAVWATMFYTIYTNDSLKVFR